MKSCHVCNPEYTLVIDHDYTICQDCCDRIGNSRAVLLWNYYTDENGMDRPRHAIVHFRYVEMITRNPDSKVPMNCCTIFPIGLPGDEDGVSWEECLNGYERWKVDFPELYQQHVDALKRYDDIKFNQKYHGLVQKDDAYYKSLQNMQNYMDNRIPSDLELRANAGRAKKAAQEALQAADNLKIIKESGDADLIAQAKKICDEKEQNAWRTLKVKKEAELQYERAMAKLYN